MNVKVKTKKNGIKLIDVDNLAITVSPYSFSVLIGKTPMNFSDCQYECVEYNISGKEYIRLEKILKRLRNSRKDI